ncbi:MAG: hypothetical protein E7630_03010 [Ruminococcaceae bacterium]|nr:hypothetical protein [Oscillospiraceae bacterium]
MKQDYVEESLTQHIIIPHLMPECKNFREKSVIFFGRIFEKNHQWPSLQGKKKEFRGKAAVFLDICFRICYNTLVSERTITTEKQQEEFSAMEGDSDDCHTAQCKLNQRYGSISTPKSGLGVFFCAHFRGRGEVIGRA